MTETKPREGDPAAGWNIPTKYLPAIESRDLPEPLPFRKIIGASVIILATALGSGELILWPYIVTQVGIGILWLAVVGFTMQFFLNMEIERYTLATGETAVAGFTRFWKPWGIIFILGRSCPTSSLGGLPARPRRSPSHSASMRIFTTT
jgi:hypothetical protein